MRTADVVVIGGGLIGLAVAANAAKRGASVLLIGESRAGEASPAGAGMLAPGAESDELRGNAVHRFATGGREMFPSYLAALREDTGIDVPLDRNGILELMADDEPAARPPGIEWLDARALRALEPALGEFAGAMLHPRDGSVDNVVMLQALRRRIGMLPSVTVMETAALSLDTRGTHRRAVLGNGDIADAGTLVLAGGAWIGRLAGLPTLLPVYPVRGQMIAFRGSPLRHVTYGSGGYLVPRSDDRTLVGATMEDVGFDSATTPDGRASLTAIAERLVPSLASAPLLSHWAGLRPLTPDHLPILGADPDVPRLLYACGHGRNGILLAPITGEVIGALAVGESSAYDLAPFSISRFAEAH